MKEKVAVIGAGNGGYAFTVFLTQRGHSVNLYESEEFKENIEEIKTRGGIESYGEVCGFVKPNLVTIDIKEAIDDVNVIIMPVPAFAHETLFNKILPHLKKGQIVLICPDNLGTLRFYEMLKKQNKENDILVAGTASLLFVAKKDKEGLGPARINVDGVKQQIRISAMPARNNEQIKDTFNNLFPNVKMVNNALENALSNVNHQLHPAPMILNAGRIESNEKFKFYFEGHTESVDKVLVDVGKEKIKVTNEFGLDVDDFDNIFSIYYKDKSTKTSNIHEKISTNICYRNVSSPDSLKSRFVIEDINYGLVLVSSMGKKCGIETPVIDSLINLACSLNQENYWEQGITLEKLGFSNMSNEEVVNYLINGFNKPIRVEKI